MVPDERLGLFLVNVNSELQIARFLFGQTLDDSLLERTQLVSVHAFAHPTHVQAEQVLHSLKQLNVDGLVERKMGVQHDRDEVLELEQKVELQCLVLGVEYENEETRTALGNLVQKRVAQLDLSQTVDFNLDTLLVRKVVVVIREIRFRLYSKVKANGLTAF